MTLHLRCTPEAGGWDDNDGRVRRRGRGSQGSGRTRRLIRSGQPVGLPAGDVKVMRSVKIAEELRDLQAYGQTKLAEAGHTLDEIPDLVRRSRRSRPTR